jgi:hypothetical protein
MTREQRVRACGSHIGLITRGPKGGPFVLLERYNKKRRIGTFRTLAALDRAIDRHMDRELAQRAGEQ